MKRVCVVSALYHPSLGGLGRQAMMLTERLREGGVNLFVIARKMALPGEVVFSGKVEVVRVPTPFQKVHILEEISMRNVIISVVFSLGCLAVLIRRRKTYDLVHFHGASITLFLCLPFLKGMGKKIVAKVAAANLGTEAGSLAGRYRPVGDLLAWMMRRVDAFIAISEEIREGLVRDGVPKERIYRISNFIDPEIFRAPRMGEKDSLKARFGYGGKTLVLFAGRFVPRKGVEHLLQAWKEVTGDFPDARLVLLGDGPLFGVLEDMASRLEINNTVCFLGRVENVPDFLRASDVFMLPSLQEGLSNSLLEALASGLPTVATEIGGVIDVVEDGRNALLVRPADVPALSKSLRTVLTDPRLRERLSWAALETIQGAYGLEDRVRRYRDLYGRL